MSRIVIGLSGRAHSGKTTITEMLVQKYGFKSLAFGDHLKHLLHGYLGIPVDDLWCDKKSPEVRKLLHAVGDMMRSEIEEDYFVRVVSMGLEMNEGIVVIEDVRYPNEIAMLKDHNAVLIRIKREDAPRIEYIGGADHDSETALEDYDAWDYVVKNIGTLEDLHNKVDTVVRDIILQADK